MSVDASRQDKTAILADRVGVRVWHNPSPIRTQRIGCAGGSTGTSAGQSGSGNGGNGGNGKNGVLGGNGGNGVLGVLGGNGATETRDLGGVGQGRYWKSVCLAPHILPRRARSVCKPTTTLFAVVDSLARSFTATL